MLLVLTAGCCGEGREPLKDERKEAAGSESKHEAPRESPKIEGSAGTVRPRRSALSGGSVVALPGRPAKVYGTIEQPGRLSARIAASSRKLVRRTIRADAALDRAAGILASCMRPPCEAWPGWLQGPVLYHVGWPSDTVAAAMSCTGGHGPGPFLAQALKAIKRSREMNYIGAAREPGTWIESLWVLLMDEHRIRLDPFPSWLPAGRTARLSFRLPRGFRKPEVYHIAPGAPTRRLALSPGRKGGRFSTVFSSDTPGRHSIEIMATSREGPRVLALFPVYVDVPIPRTASPPQGQEIQAKTPFEAERAMLDLVNKERGRRGLSPLKDDRHLAKISRRYSKEQMRRGRIAHVAPDGRGPEQRAAAAGYLFTRLGENIAQNEGVAQAHKSLMGSPAHRSAILNPHYTHAGIGVAIGGEPGKPVFFITEMFSVPQPRMSAAQARREVIRRLRRTRSRSAVPAAVEDRVLNAAARRVLRSRGRKVVRGGIARNRKVAIRLLLTGDPREVSLPSALRRRRSVRYGLAVDVRRLRKGRTYAVALVYGD